MKSQNCFLLTYFVLVPQQMAEQYVKLVTIQFQCTVCLLCEGEADVRL